MCSFVNFVTELRASFSSLLVLDDSGAEVWGISDGSVEIVNFSGIALDSSVKVTGLILLL